MDKKHYNSSYRIATYNLKEEEEIQIKKLLSNNDYINGTFEIRKINEFDNESLLSSPDVIMIGEKEEITNELSRYSKENMSQILYISNDEKVKEDNITVNLSDNESYLIIKSCAQLANSSKLSKIIENEYKEQIIKSDNLLTTLLKLNSFISKKDEYTYNHSNHVSEFSEAIAKGLNLSDDEVELIKVGGELHDIGKVGIPESIIRKETKLTKNEFEIMKMHTLIGAEIFPEKGYEKITDMIRHHHERMDGKGYPDGLDKSNLSIYARILAVADTLDAMTTQRTYNRPKTLNEAMDELKKSSTAQINSDGSIIQQLDPIVVSTLELVLKNNKYLIEYFEKNDSEILTKRNNESERRK